MEYMINSCDYDMRDFIKHIIDEYKIDYWDECLEKQDYENVKRKSNILVSCEHQKKLLGVCSVIAISKDEMYLNAFYVLKEFRKKGIIYLMDMMKNKEN